MKKVLSKAVKAAPKAPPTQTQARAAMQQQMLKNKMQKAGAMGPKPAGGAPKQQQLMALANKLRATGPKPAGGGVGSPLRGLGAVAGAARPAMKKGGMAKKRYT
jgi:hypothetical protein